MKCGYHHIQAKSNNDCMMGSWMLHSIGHLGDGRMRMAKHPMVTEPFQPPMFKVNITVLSTFTIFKKRKHNFKN